MNSGAVPGALDDIVVADFSRVLAGPLATMVLGDLGADVIKVERPGSGDDTRAWGPPYHAEGSTYYLGLNRNKRSVELDLAEPADRELARRLCVRADVVVESFRSGTMARFGLDHGVIAAANPRVVYCSITGFGEATAEASLLPAYDLLLQAVSGLMSVTGPADGEPQKVGAALIDKVCGLYAVIGILAALRTRERTGEGQRLEVSLMDSALAGLLNQGSAWLLAGEVPGRLGNRHPSIAPYQTFPTADGRIAVAAGNDAIFARLCDAVGRPGLADDPRFRTNRNRLANVDALDELLSAALSHATTSDWIARLAQARVPAGPINDIPSAYALAESLGLQPIIEAADADGETLRMARSPIRLERTPPDVRRPPPRLGEHSEEIRAWLQRERESR